MKVTLLLLAAFVLFLPPCPAQEKSSCPEIKVIPPDKAVMSGDSMIFSVSIGDKGVNDLKLEYEWKLSAGFIVDGQGTPLLRVGTAGLDEMSVTAGVEMRGLPQNCANTFSATSIVKKYPPINDWSLDCFERIRLVDEKNRLDNIVTQIMYYDDKKLIAYFYIHTEKNTALTEVNSFISRTLKHLVDKRKMPADRIVFFVVRDEPRGTRICPLLASSTEILCEACQMIKGTDFYLEKSAGRK